MLLKTLRAKTWRAIVAASIAASATFAGCAGEETLPEGGGGSGAGTTDGGGGQSSTTSTTTSSTTSSGSTTSTASMMEGGGGMGGTGGTGGMGPNPAYPLETEPNGTLATADALQMGTKGFTAEIEDSNDFDVFSVDVPLGSSMRVAISDGNGGCPPGAEVTVQIFDPDNLQMATATGLCPELSGQNNVDMAAIDPGGVHFIRVTALAPVPFYVVEIEVNPPVCGDTIVNLGEECDDGNAANGDGCDNNCMYTPVCGNSYVNYTEECDDGNLTSGDGCDSACLLEGNWCPEMEPNDNAANATPIVNCDGGAGIINPIGDKDFYSVQVTVPGSSIRAEVVDILGTGCPAGFDSVIYLYNASLIQLATDDEDGNASCSLISPLTDIGATNLPVGTYYVMVEDWLNNDTSLPYALRINVLAPGCGDGFLQAGEQCDDGNLVAGDGCDAACNLEGGICAETEPNGTQAEADSLAGCNGIAAQIAPTADKDYFVVDVTVPNSSIRAEVTNLAGTGCPTGFDSFLRLYNASAVQLGTDDLDGFDNCSFINPVTDLWARNLPVGTYYIVVEEDGNNLTSPQYKLNVQVNPPSCGDFLVQPGEECDDGNTNDGDGCDSTCQLEGNYCAEVEPNDSFAIATSLASCVGGTGSINFIGDPDYYSFDVVVPGSSVRLEVVDTTGTGCPTGFSSFLRLYNSSMMQLGTDAVDGNANCSLISPATDPFATNLSPGTYFVRVEENGNDAVSPPYILLVDVNAPGCGDGIIQTGEECDDGNNIDGDGCSSTCTLFACGPGQTSLVFDATGLPVAITDNMTVSSTINVPNTGTISKLAIVLNITHTFTGDLDISLISPNATTFDVSSDNGGGGDNYTATVFSSDSANPIASGTAPFTGVFAPEQSFAPLIGTSPTGNWQLSIFDDAGGDVGTLDTYKLVMCVAP